MNRRSFLKCAIGGTAIVVAAHAGGWTLATAKRWLIALFRKPDAVRISDTTLAAFQAGYRRACANLYKTYRRRVEEYSWFDSIPDNVVEPAGRENRIPLDFARA